MSGDSISARALRDLHPSQDAPASAWAARISACWRASVEAILEVGRLLAAAKDALPHGEFGKMINADLPFGDRTAQMLMAISADPRLSNPKHVSLLPAAWGTLHEITKLSDERFEKAIADGLIRPDMERREIAQQVKLERRATRESTLGTRQRALPDKRYGLILADPEWRFEPRSRDTGMGRAADNHYPTSPTSAICARPVYEIADQHCVLALWATAPMLPDALQVMAAWGFAYKTHCIWHKLRPGNGRGPGYWFTGEHELLLIGSRGKLPAPATALCGSVLAFPVGEHSQKPEQFAALLEAVFPTLPKIELNRRGPARPGWDAWGNESEIATDSSARVTAHVVEYPLPSREPISTSPFDDPDVIELPKFLPHREPSAA